MKASGWWPYVQLWFRFRNFGQIYSFINTLATWLRYWQVPFWVCRPRLASPSVPIREWPHRRPTRSALPKWNGPLENVSKSPPDWF